ncbi:kinase-like protein, partial [Clavulina sp. PMI_390]
YLHSLAPPVIHGDLHPGNVLINKDGIALLCDFGLSRIVHEVTRSRTKRQAGGMARFLAPELSNCSNEEFRTTKESDIYSLAMISYNMWTGNKPFFELRHEWKVLSKSVRGRRPKKPKHMRSNNLPQKSGTPFWKLLKLMWAQNKDKRPTSEMVLVQLE